MSAFDPRTQVPAKRLLRTRHRRKTPHIYSDVEIAELMSAAGRLHSPTGLRSLTFVTLIGLLAATGLRPGEAPALDVGDVDLENGVLTVRNTKFGKTRWVPIDDSTRAALTRYAERRDGLCPSRQTDAFFFGARGQRLQPSSTRRTFARLCRAVGLREPSKGQRVGRGPRMQDLRHTFATRRLVEWYRAGLDVERKINFIRYEGLTNAIAEGINNKIKLQIHKAYGFQTVEGLVAMIQLCCSGISFSPRIAS